MTQQTPADRARPGQSIDGQGDARLREHWAERVWRKSEKGNLYLNAEGYTIVLAYRGNAWTVFIENRETGLSQVGRKTYPTMEAAKTAALDALIWARKHL